MPPFPGEETLTTVYADVHTYFDAPTPRPFLHRFDKTSYFYIYYNSTRQTSRIEVALHPGSADQAAFSGYLDNVHVTNAHQFPTRVTLVVDATTGPTTTASPASARSSSREPDEWRLASADPRDPGTTRYRIHTIDFYFWNQEDAKLIVDICKRLLQPHQLDVDDDHDELEESHAHAHVQAHEVESELEPEPEPEPYPHDMVSSVVQNLEHVAISDPAYGKDKSHDPTKARAMQMPPPTQPATAAAAALGQVPSTAHAAAAAVAATSPSPGSASTNIERNHSAHSLTPASGTNFTPLAYNPAAPAAPEPIAHREDTPPPVDAANGTGLATAAMHDRAYAPAHHQQQQQQPHTVPGGVSVGVVPGAGQQPYGHYGSPPPPPPGACVVPGQPSFGPHATTTTMTTTTPPQHQHPSFAGGVGALPPQSISSALQTSPRTSGSTGFGGGTTGPSSATSPDPSRHPSVAAQHYVPHQQDPNAHIFGGQQQQQQAVQSPGAQFYQSVNAQPHKPLQHIQPQYPDYLSAGSSPPPPPPSHAAAAATPVGGYANYSYAQTGGGQPGGLTQQGVGTTGNPYDVHGQLYRPTEDEYHTHHHHQRKPSRASGSQHNQPSTVDRLEKGVGKFFKRIEKKIG
ncbi:uncharacterized protein PV06_05689 [Exophiala oligosperma]|uniref:Uncharacterized protein n=1 Tax=Exophiala oligosperma TaxID=215243 RepID=A0A0D2E2V7_9EURO|nr:uncharacterized protein PV06_05689 [Exophiala oligosperma]KIW42104.1 hypothetical protein PV06_05689 [Exophiala oligosperma]